MKRGKFPIPALPTIKPMSLELGNRRLQMRVMIMVAVLFTFSIVSVFAAPQIKLGGCKKKRDGSYFLCVS